MTLVSTPSTTAPAATSAPARKRRRSRRPRVLIAVTGLFFALLYLPIAVVALFSFNSQKSLTVFDGFSLRWYRAFVHDDVLIASLGTSLRISLVAMAGSVLLGVALAVGLVRCRTRLGSLAGLVMLVPLITPEIVTGVVTTSSTRLRPRGETSRQLPSPSDTKSRTSPARVM